jgi:hypothetical protein
MYLSYEDNSFDLLASSAGRKKLIPRFARNDKAERAAKARDRNEELGEQNLEAGARSRMPKA